MKLNKVQLLLTLAMNKRDKQALILKNATQKLERDKQQKCLLQSYQEDYYLASTNQNTTNTRESLTNFHDFMSKLQDAIRQLAERIEQQMKIVEQCQTAWLESEIVVKQLEKIIQKQQDKSHLIREKKLQKATDEVASTVSLRVKRGISV